MAADGAALRVAAAARVARSEEQVTVVAHLAAPRAAEADLGAGMVVERVVRGRRAGQVGLEALMEAAPGRGSRRLHSQTNKRTCSRRRCWCTQSALHGRYLSR